LEVVAQHSKYAGIPVSTAASTFEHEEAPGRQALRLDQLPPLAVVLQHLPIRVCLHDQKYMWALNVLIHSTPSDQRPGFHGMPDCIFGEAQ